MQVAGKGIRERSLAGSWQTVTRDHLLIGCSGAFSLDAVTSESYVMPDHPIATQEQGAHVSEVSEQGFVVSHWPMADTHYDIEEWPHRDEAGATLMKFDGKTWTRTREWECN